MKQIHDTVATLVTGDFDEQVDLSTATKEGDKPAAEINRIFHPYRQDNAIAGKRVKRRRPCAPKASQKDPEQLPTLYNNFRIVTTLALGDYAQCLVVR